MRLYPDDFDNEEVLNVALPDVWQTRERLWAIMNEHRIEKGEEPYHDTWRDRLLFIRPIPGSRSMCHLTQLGQLAYQRQSHLPPEDISNIDDGQITEPGTGYFRLKSQQAVSNSEETPKTPRKKNRRKNRR